MSLDTFSKPLLIGQVAREAQVNVETVRYYERLGLLEAPLRKESGYRQYPPKIISRIRFIRRAKELGFSLKEISELLSLRTDPSVSCDDIRIKAREKISGIEAKMKELGKMKSALESLENQCAGTGPTSECPILDALEKETGNGDKS